MVILSVDRAKSNTGSYRASMDAFSIANLAGLPGSSSGPLLWHREEWCSGHIEKE